MGKAKQTSVPHPGVKSKHNTKKTPVPSTAPLSQEFVDSSDDSLDETVPRSKTAGKPSKPKPTTTTIAIHKPKTNGVIKIASKSSTKPNGATKTVPSNVPASKSATPKKIVIENVAAGTETSDSSSEESDSESDEQHKAPDNRTTSEGTSESSSEISEDGTAPAIAQKLRVSQPTAIQTQTQTQSHTVEFRPAQPYVPPKGFKGVPTSNISSQSVQIFENLKDKQVWHITAPAGISIKDLKEFAVDKALSGQIVLRYKDTDYSLSAAEKGEEGAREVLIPRQNGFEAVPARISHSLHLQQVVQLPGLSSKQADQAKGSAAAASITASTIRAPRPQVKGLKMRFFPSGSGSQEPETLGSSDSEEERSRSTARLAVRNRFHLPAKPEKRKHGDVNEDDGIESPTKKHRKHKTPEEIKRKEDKKAKKERRRQKDLAKGKS